MYMIHLYL